MKKTMVIYKCDICGKETSTTEIRYPVLFYTEQTEGYPVKPYLSLETIDICSECSKKIIKLEGHGAQGLNHYKIVGD